MDKYKPSISEVCLQCCKNGDEDDHDDNSNDYEDHDSDEKDDYEEDDDADAFPTQLPLYWLVQLVLTG